MNRLWALNAASTPPAMPASLEIGYPKDSGVFTTAGFWWYHMVTETLMAPIVAAGLTPSGSDLSQLTQAIIVLCKANSVTASLNPVRVVDTAGGVPYSGSQTISGVPLANGDRVLRAVGSAVNNGIYVVNTSGVWPRANDMVSAQVLNEGIMTECAEGTNAGEIWMLAVASGTQATVDTTAIAFNDITGTTKSLLANYLTISSAASTYLTQSAASSTYATLANIANFITAGTAAATYLRQTDAANTYALQSSLANYLLSSTAAGTYLTQASASGTYATQGYVNGTFETMADATNKFNYLTGTPVITGLGVNVAFGGSAGYIYASGDLIAGYSDDRLKNREDELTEVMEKLMKLSVFFYTPNGRAIELGIHPQRDLGMSAQELLAMFPTLVVPSPVSPTQDMDDPECLFTVRYDRLGPILVVGLQETFSIVKNVVSDVERIKTGMRRGRAG